MTVVHYKAFRYPGVAKKGKLLCTFMAAYHHWSTNGEYPFQGEDHGPTV